MIKSVSIDLIARPRAKTRIKSRWDDHVNYSFGNKQNPVPLTSPKFASDQRSLNWKQVHGTTIVEVTHSAQNCGKADGFWTTSAGLAIGVITADCVPILLYRKDGEAVGALHAGWRGVAGHIVRAFFAALPLQYSNPCEWSAVIGPSIRECCYEFGSEELSLIANQFKALTHKQLSPRGTTLDLLAPIQCELAELGVEVIFTHPDCTYCARDANQEPVYFSYRRGDRNSRQFSIIEKSGR